MASSERTRPAWIHWQTFYTTHKNLSLLRVPWSTSNSDLFKWSVIFDFLFIEKYSLISLKIPWNDNRAVDIVQSQLMDATLRCLSLFLTRLPFLLPTGSPLPLCFLILISVTLNLISMMWFEEPGVIAMLMFTFSFSWHSLLSYCFDNEDLSLTFLLFSDDSLILMFVAVSFWRSSTWIAQSTLSR